MVPRSNPDSARYNEGQSTARRSVSIFSRRGTSSPKTKSFSICQTFADTPSKICNSPTHGSSISWPRVSRSAKQNDRGTILHAVPLETSGISLSPLEMAMATSPNEEILHAIGRSSISTGPHNSPVSGGWVQNHELARSSFPGRGSVQSRIGIWRDGVAFWDIFKQKFEDKATRSQNPPVECSPTTGDKIRRPRLSVVIPDHELRLGLDIDSPETARTHHPLPSVHVAPAAVTARYHVPSRTNSSSNQSAIHPAFRASSPSGEDQSSSSVRPLPNHENSRSSISSKSHDNSRSSISSNTIFQDDTFDRVSCYSRQSSMTSVDPEDTTQNPDWSLMDMPKRTVSAAFSIASPVKAGVFDETTVEEKCIGSFTDYATPRSSHFLSVSAGEPSRSRSSTFKSNVSIACPKDRSLGISNAARPTSPTVSEAFFDLQAQLDAIKEEPTRSGGHDNNHLKAQDLGNHVDTTTPKPPLPRKSRKREWKASGNHLQATSARAQANLPVRRRSVPSSTSTMLHSGTQLNSDMKRVRSVRADTSAAERAFLPRSICTSKSSPYESRYDLPLIFEQERVCVGLMESMSTLEDLKALSVVNRTMRRAFEQNEMRLIKSVLRNDSPPAWELREWSSLQFGDIVPTDALANTGLTPSAYISCVRRDHNVIQELKGLIIAKCQSFLRPETVSALTEDDDANSSRIDAAFYRIWSFCKIFGCDKGRDNDLRGQLDWLKGGVLAHQDGCAATLDFKPDFDMDGVLVNPPDYFALGNTGGLSAGQLYDMTEIWDCLGMLMQGYEDRTIEAQRRGIFKDILEASADRGTQKHVLQEWIAYILTLGPSVVLELSRFSNESRDAGLGFAALNGWTDWTLSYQGTSRVNFLRNPVAQLYEEHLIASTTNNRENNVGKRLLRRHQAEAIKLARVPANVPEWPLSNKIDDGIAFTLGRRDSHLAPEVFRTTRQSSMSASPVINGRVVSPAMWSTRKVSPIIEDRVETFNRLSMLSFEGIAEDTSERAISKIVDMGFTASQAKGALRMTDVGTGLRVDRALELLLR